MKKLLIIIPLILLIAGVAYGIYDYTRTYETISTIENGDLRLVEDEATDEADFEGINPDADIALASKDAEKSALQTDIEAKDPSNTDENFNILILGIDRRHGGETHWRTDVIQLVTLSPDRKTGVVTHIPRDVWADTYKINAIYNLQGPNAIKNYVQKITGQRPDRIIRIDFDAFVWAVDGVGGVTINVPTAFTDTGYPNDRKGSIEPITVSFEAGEQVMDGETALIYARSRKGNNGEGSDYARGKRQQLIMRAIVADYFKPGNLFEPKTAETLFKLATQYIYTDITLADTKVLFEVMKNYENIELKQFGLDTSNYLTVPGTSERDAYGGAWVLVPINNDYIPIHNEINRLLGNNPEPVAVQTETETIITKDNLN